ncbi:MAG TPA: iron chelate uptake ABC transporter family permease subunit, partial [Aggregatilineales bacterium]|nr:iron chelate uptake ABC transporter family permease subunit [Aggregatilineales bacterium]
MRAVATKQGSRSTRLIQSRALLSLGLIIGLGLLILLVGWSITLGAADISLATIWDSIFAFDNKSFHHLVIQTSRLPRVVSGVLVGASLAVAGGIMQGLTRNPLASPDILGINSGAAFAVVLLVFLTGNPPLSAYAIVAIIGA